MVLTLVYPVVNLLFQLIVDIEISNPPFIVSLPFFSFRILDVCHSRVLKAKNSLTPPLRWSTTILLWISTPALFQLYGLFRARRFGPVQNRKMEF